MSASTMAVLELSKCRGRLIAAAGLGALLRRSCVVRRVSATTRFGLFRSGCASGFVTFTRPPSRTAACALRSMPLATT